MIIILLVVVLIAVFGIVAAMAVQKGRSVSPQGSDETSVLEIRKDMNLMMEEMKGLYADKASLLDENKKLKQEIESLKKS